MAKEKKTPPEKNLMGVTFWKLDVECVGKRKKAHIGPKT